MVLVYDQARRSVRYFVITSQSATWVLTSPHPSPMQRPSPSAARRTCTAMVARKARHQAEQTASPADSYLAAT